MKEFTTREHLEEDLYGCMNAAVLDYGDHVITVLEHCFEGIKVAVYELIETPEETGLADANAGFPRLPRIKALRIQAMRLLGH